MARATVDDTEEDDAEDPCGYSRDSVYLMESREFHGPEGPLRTLHADHPYMQAYQEKLKKHLLKKKEALLAEINTLEYNNKLKGQKGDDLAEKLYERQQLIQQQENQIMEFADKAKHFAEVREKGEKAVAELREKHSQMSAENDRVDKLTVERQQKLKRITEMDMNIRKWAEEIEMEVKNARSIVGKDEMLQKQKCEERKKAELFAFHMELEVHKKEKELQLIEEQKEKVTKIVELLENSAKQANFDLDQLKSEQEHLTAQWVQVILSIGKNDKILAGLRNEIQKKEEHIKLCKANIIGAKKEIAKEFALNGKLEAFEVQIKTQLLHLRSDCSKHTEALTTMEDKLNQFPAIIERSEKDLQEAQREGHRLSSALRKLEVVIDRMHGRKFKIEEDMLKMNHEHLTTDKQATHVLKLIGEAQEHRRSLDLTYQQSKNAVAQLIVQKQKIQEEFIEKSAEQRMLQQKLDELEKEFDSFTAQHEQMVKKTMNKLKEIEKLNIKVDELNRQNISGGMSPTERQIKLLEKNISHLEVQISDAQHFWIILQNHIVNLTEKRSDQINELQVVQKQLSIIQQKGLKVDAQLAAVEAEQQEITRDVREEAKKVKLLNAQLYKTRQAHEAEEMDCENEHRDLMDKLKEKEMDMIKFENEILDLQNDVEHIKNEVVAKHEEALTIETKFKLIEDTLQHQKNELSNTGEMHAIRQENRRIKINLEELRREQIKLSMQLQQSIDQRERIFEAAEMRERIKVKGPGASAVAQRKIKRLEAQLEMIKLETRDLVNKKLVESAEKCKQLQAEVVLIKKQTSDEIIIERDLAEKIVEASLKKLRNLEKIVRKQRRSIYYREIAKRKRLRRTTHTMDKLKEKLQEQLVLRNTYVGILNELIDEFKDMRMNFQKLMIMLED